MSWTGVITNAGQALLNAWALGGHTLTIDGATVGSGYVAAANMRLATSLSSEKDDASIVRNEEVSGGIRFKIQVGAINGDAYTAHEIGLWGHLDDEESSTLIALHQDPDSGISVPTKTEMPDFAFAIYLVHAISNDGTLTITINHDAYASVSDLDEATDELEAEITSNQVLMITTSSFSSLPQTVSNAKITADHVVIQAVLSSPAAQRSDWTVTTSAGSLTISGTISGSTTATLYLALKQ